MKNKKREITRPVTVRVRLTPKEDKELRTKADLAGRTLSQFIRESVLRTRTWTAKNVEVEKERTRAISRMGQNLNQIARVVNSKKGVDSVLVLGMLSEIESSLQTLLTPTAQSATADDSFDFKGVDDAR